MKRGVATYGSWLYCSKNIHCSTRARLKRSLGMNGEPSARYQRIAFDSARKLPSSSSNVGIRPFGFLARNWGVRVAPVRMSTSTQRYGSFTSAHSCLLYTSDAADDLLCV